MKVITLSANEKAELDKQDSSKKKDGGWQSLIVSLQDRVGPSNNSLTLTDDDLERIPRYAFDYGNGGWENQLTSVFGNHLGLRLGR